MGLSTVLLADDNGEMRSIVQRALKAEYRILESLADGLAVLERVPELKPDVVVLDISMLGMDGFGLCSSPETTECSHKDYLFDSP